MIKLTPDIFNGKDEIAIGESDMCGQAGYPLKLSYTVVWICLSGRAVVSVNFKNYLFKSGSILVLAEDSIVIIKRLSSDFRLFYCLIHKSLAAEVAYNLPNPLFSYLDKAPLLIPDETEASLLKMWQAEIGHIVQTGTTYRHIMLRNHLQNFFLETAERIPAESPTGHKFSHKEILCWKFWDLIGRYSKQHRDVAFYAKELHITPFYLSQLTKKYMNESPKELINRQVVLEIKNLLTSTKLSIKEIAEQLNFEDPSYLCRYFKRLTGVSLTGYRK